MPIDPHHGSSLMMQQNITLHQPLRCTLGQTADYRPHK